MERHRAGCRMTEWYPPNPPDPTNSPPGYQPAPASQPANTWHWLALVDGPANRPGGAVRGYGLA